MSLEFYFSNEKDVKIILSFFCCILKSIGSTTENFSWGHSSAGRAPAWHAGGQRFESAWLHQDFR